jgi:hypothetical protein
MAGFGRLEKLSFGYCALAVSLYVSSLIHAYCCREMFNGVAYLTLDDCILFQFFLLRICCW